MRKNDTLNEIDEYYSERNHEENNPSNSQNSKAAKIILIVFIMTATLFIAIMIMLFSEKLTPQAVCNVGLSTALLLGLCLLIIPPVFRNRKKNRCTVQVTIRCIDLIRKVSYSGENHHKTITYAPVWEYDYNGNTYIYAENVYSNVDVPPIDSEREGTINPDNPNELYRPNPTAAAIILFLGIIITLVGVLGLIIINLLFGFMNSFDTEAIRRILPFPFI